MLSICIIPGIFYRDFIVKTKTNLYTKRVYKITVKEGAVFCGRMVKK